MVPGNSYFGRVTIGAIIVLPAVFVLVVNLDALHSPPAWDSSVTVSPAAITIAQSDFAIWDVANLKSSPAGGPSTHATSLYTIGLALLIAALGPANAFFAAHVFSVVLIAALSGTTYLLARTRNSTAVSVLIAVTVSVLPLVVQQASDIYLDLPLAVLATLAAWSSSRRRFWLTSVLVLFAVAIKSSGVFLLPLILVTRPTETPFRRHLVQSLIAGLTATIPFIIVFITTHRFANIVTNATRLNLMRSSLALLILTVDVAGLLAIYLIVQYGRARAGRLDRTCKVGLIMVASFFAVHTLTIILSGTIAILPRYYIALLPIALASMLPAEGERGTRYTNGLAVGTAAMTVLFLFSLINIGGEFYPRANDDFYVIAERSTRAQELLALHVLGTRQLVGQGVPILADRQIHFRLLYPEMGYVDRVPREITSVFIEDNYPLPNEFAMLIERRFANPLEEVEKRALDEGYDLVYETIEFGQFTSELVRAAKP